MTQDTDRSGETPPHDDTTHLGFDQDFARKLFAVGLLIVGLYLLWAVASAATTMLFLFFGAALLAVSFHALASRLSAHTPLPYKASVLVVVAVSFVAWSLLSMWIGPRFGAELGTLLEEAPRSWVGLREMISTLPLGDKIVTMIPKDPSELGGLSSMGTRVTHFFSVLSNLLTYIVVLLFVGLFLALDPKMYQQGVLRLTPKNNREEVQGLMAALNEKLTWWIIGRVASMSIVGAFVGVSLWIADVPMPFALAVIAAVLSFVPFFGPLLSVFPALVAAASVSTNLVWITLGIYAGVQFVESYIATPLIQKRATSVPPALMLAGQSFFGLAAGPLGIIYATPMIVVIMTIFDAVTDPVDEETAQELDND